MMPLSLPRALAALLLTTALGGCTSWLGSGHPGEHPAMYAPTLQIAADPAWPQVARGLLIATPDAAPMLGSQRVVIRTTADELQLLRGARWARPAPELLQDALLHLLEDSGKLPAVARQGSTIAADWILLMDIRRFEADYRHNAIPSVDIAVSAKLVSRPDQRIIASRIFTHSEKADASSNAAIIGAFIRNLQHLTPQLAGWVLRCAAASGASSPLPQQEGEGSTPSPHSENPD